MCVQYVSNIKTYISKYFVYIMCIILICNYDYFNICDWPRAFCMLTSGVACNDGVVVCMQVCFNSSKKSVVHACVCLCSQRVENVLTAGPPRLLCGGGMAPVTICVTPADCTTR